MDQDSCQEKGLVLHHVSLADNYNLDKAGDFLTQLLVTGLTEDQVANAEVLKNLNLQDEDATIKQFVFQGQCLILGDSGAGKTSLVNSLTGKPFDPSQTKTGKMEQKLVDEKWKNLGMKDLLFGNLWWFCRRICVQLTLYGPEERQNILVRILDDWRNVFLEVNTMGLIHIIGLVGLCNLIVDIIVKTPLISPLLLLIVLLYIVFLYLFNYNYTFRLMVTTFAFTVRTSGLLIGSFSALTLVCYHYGEISLNVDGILLIILTLGLATVVHIILGLGVTWQCPYPRQIKFKYKSSLKIVCFMPFLLSVLVGQATFSALAVLLITYWTGLGLPIKNPHKFVQTLVLLFSFWWTAELLKSAYTYIKIILFKWLYSRHIFKVAVTCTLITVYIFLFIQLINMYWYLSLGSITYLIFLCDSLLKEWLNMQELGIEGNKFTAVVIEKQELHKERLKVALHKKFSSIKWKILDFPGEEEYHAYYRLFFRRKAFYVIVFNMMDFAENNFNEIDAKCKRLQYWFETLCSHVPPKTPIFLVGTQRGDMDGNNIKRLDTHLKRCLWNTYCDALVANDTEYLVFFPIENSKGKEESGVQVLQEKITTVAKEKKVKETFGREIPLSWVRVQDAIVSLKEQKGIKFCLCLEEFSNVVDNFDNFSSTNWSKEILHYFHETGLVIYLEGDQDLYPCKWILLKPEILVDIIIQLDTPPPEITQERGLRCDWNLLRDKGLLTKSLLENIILKLKENVEGMTAFLEEYDLICPLANRKVNVCNEDEDEEQPTHFVPSLLPMASETGMPIWYDDDTDKKCYVFFTKFLPEPLFHHLLSRAHKLSKVEFCNGHTFLFRDVGKFWLSAWQTYSLKLMREEKMIEVTFSYR